MGLPPEGTLLPPHRPRLYRRGPLEHAYPRGGGRRGRNPPGREWVGFSGPCRKASSSTWGRSPASGGGGGRRCAVGGKAEGTRAASAAFYTAAPDRGERAG